MRMGAFGPFPIFTAGSSPAAIRRWIVRWLTPSLAAVSATVRSGLSGTTVATEKVSRLPRRSRVTLPVRPPKTSSPGSGPPKGSAPGDKPSASGVTVEGVNDGLRRDMQQSDVAALRRWALEKIARLEAGGRLTNDDADYLRRHLPTRHEDRSRFQRDLDRRDALTQDGFRLGWSAGDEYTQSLYDELAARAGRSRTAAAPPPRSRASRPRRRLVNRGRARSPDDPEPPPALAGKRYSLICQADACGEAFTSARPHTRTCSSRCRQRLHVQRAASVAQLLYLGDIARSLLIAGQIEPVEALELVVWPSRTILEAVADQASV